jgi:hypothetical protein
LYRNTIRRSTKTAFFIAGVLQSTPGDARFATLPGLLFFPPRGLCGKRAGLLRPAECLLKKVSSYFPIAQTFPAVRVAVAFSPPRAVDFSFLTESNNRENF